MLDLFKLEAKTVAVDEYEPWCATSHVFDDKTILAVKAAMASGRPLLVCGEPGIGKTQLALAVASVLKFGFLYKVLNSKTQSTDLQYYYDAVARLGEAQVLSAKGDKCDLEKLMNPQRFLCPSIFWWAFNPISALKQYGDSIKSFQKPNDDEIEKLKRGAVVLIDEIDKADPDVPNGLLETLGNFSFSVPFRSGAIEGNVNKTFVVITTNNERSLPNAFVRRCIVLNMSLKEDKEGFVEQLCLIAKSKNTFDNLKDHIIEKVAEEVYWYLMPII